MPDRLIRDELLTSERYWRVSPEARCLYLGILLSADDTARYTGSDYALRTRCLGGSVAPERIPILLAELVDCDLIRLYEHNGARFVFVPRFRQRLRYQKSRYPAPPNEINDLIEKKTVLSQTQVRLKSDFAETTDFRPACTSEHATANTVPCHHESNEINDLTEKKTDSSLTSGGEEKRREEKEKTTTVTPPSQKSKKNARKQPFTLPDWLEPHRDVWDAWVEARTRSKHPPTDWAKNLAVAKLEHLQAAGYKPRLLLAEAAFHNWQSFYPPKDSQR